MSPTMKPPSPDEPPGYREARNALLEAEDELRERIEEVAALRLELPLGGRVKESMAVVGRSPIDRRYEE